MFVRIRILSHASAINRCYFPHDVAIRILAQDVGNKRLLWLPLNRKTTALCRKDDRGNMNFHFIYNLVSHYGAAKD